MGQVILSFSMSLDGFIAGPDVSPGQAMGVGGEQLHRWMRPGSGKNCDSEIDEDMAQELFRTVGAVVLGRTTYEVGLEHWGDTPYPVPSFVLTREQRDPRPMKSDSFTFVNDGIQSALWQANAAAGEKDVVVMGANAAQQCLNAGLADVIVIQLVPVLLGSGKRLFERISDRPVQLAMMRAIPSPSVIHLRYQIAK